MSEHEVGQILEALRTIRLQLDGLHNQILSHRDRLGRLEAVTYGSPPPTPVDGGSQGGSNGRLRWRHRIIWFVVQLGFVLALVFAGGLLLGSPLDYPRLAGLVLLGALIAGIDGVRELWKRFSGLRAGAGPGQGAALGAAFLVVTAAALGGVQ